MQDWRRFISSKRRQRPSWEARRVDKFGGADCVLAFLQGRFPRSAGGGEWKVQARSSARVPEEASALPSCHDGKARRRTAGWLLLSRTQMGRDGAVVPTGGAMLSGIGLPSIDRRRTAGWLVLSRTQLGRDGVVAPTGGAIEVGTHQGGDLKGGCPFFGGGKRPTSTLVS